MSETERAAATDDVAIRLSYLDKLFAAFQRQQQAFGRQVRLQAVVSLLLLGLASGLVSADESLEISGIKLELPLWTVMGGAAGALALLSASIAVSWARQEQLGVEVLELFGALDYDVPQRLDDHGIGLGSGVADAVTSALSPGASVKGRDVFGFVFALGIILVISLLPVAAEVAVLIKLITDFGWKVQVFVPLGLMLLVSVASIIWLMTEAFPSKYRQIQEDRSESDPAAGEAVHA